jgi:hypothetical protein
MDTELQLATGYIETFAGNGKARSTGDGKRAVKAGIPLPHHAALDKNERWLYFRRVRLGPHPAHRPPRGHAAQLRRHRRNLLQRR